jgi:hypothetical protein
MANGKPITNDKIYDLINSVRLELKGDIAALRSDFTQLEAGRLTRLEGKVADFEVAQTKRDTTILSKVLLLWSVGGLVAVALVTALAYRFIVGANKP